MMWSVFILGLAVLGLFAASHFGIERASRDRIFAGEDFPPARKVGLVLGCARYLADGRENRYFRYRIDAAAALFHAGRVEFLLVSGDNHRKSVNEPEDMKAALMERGVPEDRIVCDYAGFRTFDSVVRARYVFELEEAIVISQDWHTRRAVYLAGPHGLDLYGYAARDVLRRAGLRTKAREQLARVKAFLDLHLLRTRPRFLGEPVPIGVENL